MIDEIKELHTKVDFVMIMIDGVKEETQNFYDKYNKELDDNKVKDEHLQQQGQKGEYMKKSAQNAVQSLTKELIDDVRFGADQLRTSIKEKYLGRLPGTRRGEVTL